jgi:hypothetical protein
VRAVLRFLPLFNLCLLTTTLVAYLWVDHRISATKAENEVWSENYFKVTFDLADRCVKERNKIYDACAETPGCLIRLEME